MTMPRTYTLTEAEAELAFRQVANHCQALKNWIAGAVEAEKFDRAAELVSELRHHEHLFAKLNVAVHREIDAPRAGA